MCALLLSALTLGVESGSVAAFDRQSELRIHAAAPSALSGAMTGLSFIGASWPMALLTLAWAAIFLIRWAPRLAAIVAACPAGASLLDIAMKTIIHRHRPHLWPQAAILTSYSFPSGHATISSAFFGGVTYAIWTNMGRLAGTFAAVLSVLFVAGIGLSRVYLGVHWPSDVIAGFALGCGWVFLLLIIANSLRRDAAPQQG